MQMPGSADVTRRRRRHGAAAAATFTCCVCEAGKPREAFDKTQAGRAAKGNRARCRACLTDARRAKTYGLSPDQYRSLWAKQSDACAVCRIALAALPAKDIHIDHDHATGAVRGIVCAKCNLGLGQFRDNAVFLLRAALYLMDREPAALARA